MPSRPRSLTNGHPRSPRKLPWFLDALLWIRALVSEDDRAILDLVRLDLAEELDALLAEGVRRRAACREVWGRVRLECRFFAPRALHWQRTRLRQVMRAPRWPRTVLRTTAVVGVCGVALLSAKWFVLDPAFARQGREVARLLRESLTQAAQTHDSLEKFGDTGPQPLTREMQDLLARHLTLQERLREFDRAHPHEYSLRGWIGLIDEDVARFWEGRGDAPKAEAHWQAALCSYAEGANEQDSVASFRLGLWLLDRQALQPAAYYLRSAFEHWPGVFQPGVDLSARVAAEFHWVLLELWRSERTVSAAYEAHMIEEWVLQRHRSGDTREFDFQILHNAICLRVRMIEDRALDPAEGLNIVNLAHRALDVAGSHVSEIAGWMITDQDLEPVRHMDFFASVIARANAIRGR